MERISRKGKYYKFAVYVVIVILINIAGVTLFFRADLTSDNIYSLSEVSKEVVSTLSEPLTIKVFFTEDLPAPHNNTERYLRDLLEEYSINSNDYFNYKFYNVSPKQGDIEDEARRNQELAHSYGIYPVQVRNIEQDEVQFKKAYMGLAMIHGDVIDKIPSISTTEGIEYDITSKIEKMNSKISALLNLDEQIKVKLYYSPSLEKIAPQVDIDNLASIPVEIDQAVEELNDKFYSRLEYQLKTPDNTPSFEEETNRYNIMKLRWKEMKNEGGETVIPAGAGALGIVVSNRDKYQTIELIDVVRVPLFGTQYRMADLDNIDAAIEEAVDDILDVNKKIGYLADHGTPPLMGNPQQTQKNPLSNFNSLVSESYSISQVNLREEGIPEGIDCLIMAGPREPFSDYELFQIDQFLMKGKSLALFLDPFNEFMPENQQMMNQNRGPSYLPVNTGLEKLLDHYGIQTEKSYVLDRNCYEQKMPEMYGGGKQNVYFAPMILNRNINSEIDFMKNIKGLITLKTSPVYLMEDRLSANQNLEGHVLFSSSDQAWEMSERINLNPMMTRPPQDQSELGQFPLSVLLEGEFTSYFQGREIPEKPREEEEEDDESEAETTGDETEQSQISGERMFLQKSRKAGIFTAGSSEILSNSILDQEGKAPTSTFVMNMIDHLNGRTGYAQMRSKSQRFNPLEDSSAGVKTFIKTFNIAGLPVLVIICGIIIWMRREARKRRIYNMFTE
ncbi:MAG: Gldg family protein [Candidatus Krumholzibacteriales bacterium]